MLGLSIVAVLLLAFAGLQTGLARWAYRDASGRRDRVPGLDAAMVGIVPLVGVYAYRRSVRETEAGEDALPDGVTRHRLEKRERRVADDLIPQLTEQLRTARTEADRCRLEAEQLGRENFVLRAENERLTAELERLRGG